MNVLYIVALPAPRPFLIVPWNFTEGLNQAGCHPAHLLRVCFAKEHKTSCCPVTLLSVSDKEQKQSLLNWHQDLQVHAGLSTYEQKKGTKAFSLHSLNHIYFRDARKGMVCQVCINI